MSDLTIPGIKILVVEDAGQVGMWEDVAGSTEDVKLVEGIRRNIAFFGGKVVVAKC